MTLGETADIRNAYNWNASKLAKAFGMHRNTVASRLQDAGVMPVAKQGNAPLYSLEEVGPALFGQQYASGNVADPDQLDPKSRKDWYQSENERLKFEIQERHVIPDDEVGREMAKVIKAIANMLDSLTDVLERECGMTGEQLEIVQRIIDAAREIMYLEAIE